MTQVIVNNKGIEQALKEFHRMVQDDGIIREIRARAHFIPKAEARKLKSIEARKRNRPRSAKPADKRPVKV
jgi:ribosomal protein S21